MVFRIVRQLNDNLRRRVRRAFLAEPDKTPQRIATVMASILLISIVITYNVLYEREKAKAGTKPPTLTELYQQRNEKKKLEHLELQRNIIQARNQTKEKPVQDL